MKTKIKKVGRGILWLLSKLRFKLSTGAFFAIGFFAAGGFLFGILQCSAAEREKILVLDQIIELDSKQSEYDAITSRSNSLEAALRVTSEELKTANILLDMWESTSGNVVEEAQRNLMVAHDAIKDRAADIDAQRSLEADIVRLVREKDHLLDDLEREHERYEELAQLNKLLLQSLNLAEVTPEPEVP